MNIFVTSIGANAGKTVFSAGIAAVMQSLCYEMAIFKPVQVGCKYASDKQFSPDLNFVKKIDPNIKTYSTYNYKQKILPAVAAESERIKYSVDSIIRTYNDAKKENDIIIVEGTGGILEPISGRVAVADLPITLKLPTVIVVNVEDDFVNKTLMTLKVAEMYRHEILGLILNKYSYTQKNNPYHAEVKFLEQSIDYDILGTLPDLNVVGEGINAENLVSETLQNVDLSRVFGMEIPKLLF